MLLPFSPIAVHKGQFHYTFEMCPACFQTSMGSIKHYYFKGHVHSGPSATNLKTRQKPPYSLTLNMFQNEMQDLARDTLLQVKLKKVVCVICIFGAVSIHLFVEQRKIEKDVQVSACRQSETCMSVASCSTRDLQASHGPWASGSQIVVLISMRSGIEMRALSQCILFSSAYSSQAELNLYLCCVCLTSPDKLAVLGHRHFSRVKRKIWPRCFKKGALRSNASM